MLPTDVSAPATRTLARLPDSRVRQYYDPDRLLADRMKLDARAPQPTPSCCTRGGVLWDLLAIYPPGSTWTDRMPIAEAIDGPVVDVVSLVEKALAAR